MCARTLDAGLGDLIISRLKSYLVENIWATTYHANHSLDGPMNACWSENSKCNIFRNSIPKVKFISPLVHKIRNMKCV